MSSSGDPLARWPLAPMMATPSSRLPADGAAWAYEVKWDGVRALAFHQEGRWRLQSRTGRDITAQYPEMSADPLPAPAAIVDGELVAFDAEGRPSFERLQSRINLSRGADVERARRTTPVVYIAFDLLHLGNEDITALAYVERRQLLADLGLEGAHRLVPGYHLGDGPALLEATRQRSLEGVVAKRADGPYLPGRRSQTWLKIKHFLRQEFVIGGWLPGEGGRSGSLGALLVGYHEGDDLVYAGRVGTGLTDAELARLLGLLSGLARTESPFRWRPGLPGPRSGVHWAEPQLVAEVAFSEWTAGGTLRAPSYKGLRPDRPALEVIRET